MKRILLLCLIISSTKIYSQDYFKTEFSSGFIVVDKFHDERDTENYFYSTMVQTDLMLYRHLEFERKFNLEVGLGYTRFLFLDAYESNLTGSYISFKSRFNHRLFFDRLDLILGQSTYFSLNSGSKDVAIHPEFRRKIFTNIDIGLKYKLSEKFDLSVTTPVTIYPMYFSRFTYVINPPDPFVLFGETTGFNIGISYKFKK